MRSNFAKSRAIVSASISMFFRRSFLMVPTMTEGNDKVLSKRDKSKSMSDTTFMQNNLPEVFDPRRYGSVKAAQIAAYDFMKGRVNKNLKLRRIRQLWEGKTNRVDAEEKDALIEAQIEEARNEYQTLRLRLARLEALLAVADQAGGGAALDRRGWTPRGLDRRNRP